MGVEQNGGREQGQFLDAEEECGASQHSRSILAS
jgi:hypothetical protein